MIDKYVVDFAEERQMVNTHKDVFAALCTSRGHIDPTTCSKLAELAETDTVTPEDVETIIATAEADACGMNALSRVLYSLQREEYELAA